MIFSETGLEAQIQLKGPSWFQDGQCFTRWTVTAKVLLNRARLWLHKELKPYLSPYCTHIKGHSGVKGTVRWLMRQLNRFHFAARFDVVSYYQSMRHDVTLELLSQLGADRSLQAIVRQYLQAPDINHSRIGMVAGGSLSPLLGALYLLPLDKAMARHTAGGEVFYVRYMDDIIIMAKKRWHLRSAVKTLYNTIQPLGLRVHQQEKRFIGRVEKGVDFLGYRFQPSRKLRPSAESLRRLALRASRLYEQGADINRLRLYVTRWTRWLWGGLPGMVSLAGGMKRYLVYVLKQLQIKGLSLKTA